MKRMHETDGTKNTYQNYHYPYHHQHFNNYTNGGYQHMNNNGSYHNNNNNNPSGYHNNYRNNYGGNRRQFRHKYQNSQQYNNNNQHHHQHHHHHHQPFHCQIPQQQQQQQMGPMPEVSAAAALLPTPQTQSMDENNAHSYSQQQQSATTQNPPIVSCLTPEPSPGSKTNESKEKHEPQPQSQSSTQTVPLVSLPSSTSSFVSPDMVEDPHTNSHMLMTLSDAIWKKYIGNQQSTEVFRKKMDLWKELFDLYKATHGVQYPRYMLQIVGSTMSGFGSRSSDMDVCLMIRKSEVDQRIEAVDRLHEFQSSLQKIPFMEKIELIYAKVPILKFRDAHRGLDVDLNCNNSVGIRNTHLLYCYSQLDWRVKPLVLVTKLWAQFHGINDAKNMTISSYSLVLMVIHYLQFGCKEPVLPCLHQMYPEKFSPFIDVEKIKINEQISKWDSQNRHCLGDLLIGFLEYFSRKFDYSRQAVSVRLGCHVPIKLCMQARSFKNDPHQWKYLCVEEPFDLTNTARSVYDKEAFDRIRGVFYTSWNRLYVTKDLASIFHTIPDSESRGIASRMPQILLR